jgi:REP element-mobilizing transposase RayT
MRRRGALYQADAPARRRGGEAPARVTRPTRQRGGAVVRLRAVPPRLRFGLVGWCVVGWCVTGVPRWRFGLVELSVVACEAARYIGPMSSPLAYFISWTVKGCWLHGDARGFVVKGVPGIQPHDRKLNDAMRDSLREQPHRLSPEQRCLVEQTIRDHCCIRAWTLHAVNARTTHVHVVVTATDVTPETVMEQFKAWCSRRLNERCKGRRKWWTEHGSTLWINDEASFVKAVDYVLNRQ